MYTIACKDLGIDCRKKGKGATPEEAIAKGMEHVKATHMSDPKVMEMMKMPEDQMMAMAKSVGKMS